MSNSAFNREKWLEWCEDQRSASLRERMLSSFARGFDDAIHHRGRNCPRDRKAYDDYNNGYSAGQSSARKR